MFVGSREREDPQDQDPNQRSSDSEDEGFVRSLLSQLQFPDFWPKHHHRHRHHDKQPLATSAHRHDSLLGKLWHKHPSAAKRLNDSLQPRSGFDVWKRRVIGTLSLVELGGVAAACGGLLSPKGPGCCDHNNFERVANVLTSIPYVMVGVHTYRTRTTEAGKLWGASIAGVGLASATFHASHGRWRSIGRKLDYWTIAGSSNLLARAVFPQIPTVATATGLAVTPVRPFAVSFANTLGMELRFLQRALEEPKLRTAQRLHSACAVAGMTFFTLEDYYPRVPLMHSTWHCFSAVCCLTTNAILKDAEERQRQRDLGRTASAVLREGMGRDGAAKRSLDEATKPMVL